MLHDTTWSFLGMHFIWWFVWIVLISMAFTSFTPVAKSQLKSGERALDILRRRYAAGQITTEEYERRRNVLAEAGPSIS